MADGEDEKNMADGEDEPVFEVDQKLSESQNFTLYKELQGYHNFKGPSLVWLFKYTGNKASRKAKRNCHKSTTYLQEIDCHMRTFRFRFRCLFSYSGSYNFRLISAA